MATRQLANRRIDPLLPRDFPIENGTIEWPWQLPSPSPGKPAQSMTEFWHTISPHAFETEGWPSLPYVSMDRCIVTK
jgi:hypothetical protein